MKVERIVVAAALVVAFAVPVKALQEVTAEDYDAAMKTIRATVQGVGDHLEAQDAPSVGADGNTLIEQFTKVNAYWNNRREEDAIALSDQALAAARVFQRAGAAGDFDLANRAFTELRGTCMECHNQYRERDADGNWRIKGGGN
jgi:cytochrome c556